MVLPLFFLSKAETIPIVKSLVGTIDEDRAILKPIMSPFVTKKLSFDHCNGLHLTSGRAPVHQGRYYKMVMDIDKLTLKISSNRRKGAKYVFK